MPSMNKGSENISEGQVLLGMVTIPAGSFLMGTDRGPDNEAPAHRVHVDEFDIANKPVANHQYERFIRATGSFPPPWWVDPMFSHPDQPVVGVNWHEASRYCEWLSELAEHALRLPTEAEWEKAIRGGLSGKRYPWGDEPPDQRAFSGIDPATGGPQHVGSNEPNGFGIFDMSEGVHEWCQDHYDADYYKNSATINPRGPLAGARRVSRGGSWRHRVKFSRCAARSSLNPNFRYSDYGFRIAMDRCRPWRDCIHLL